VDCQWPLSTGLKLQGISTKGNQQLQASFTPDGSGESRPDSRLTMEVDLAVICNRAKPAYDVPYQLGADISLQPDLGGFALSGASHLTAVGEAAGELPGGGAQPAGEVNTP